jgi:glutamate synthase domain-containing protein 3
MKIDARNLGFKALNEKVRNADGDVEITNVVGERFIACGLSDKTITVTGTPGNALGAYLDGAKVVINGNGQDAVGDTMNDGKILIRGSAGDALGYAMRGGRIFIGGDTGYRCGVHMKEYKEKKPVIIIGGSAGSFLGEYMSGGLIAVLNLGDKKDIVGNFTGVGMYGGKIFLRAKELNAAFPPQVKCVKATAADVAEIADCLREYADDFALNAEEIIGSDFFMLTPDSANPYKRLYTNN